MISSTFFFLFSQLGVGMMLTLLYFASQHRQQFLQIRESDGSNPAGRGSRIQFAFPIARSHDSVAGYLARDLGTVDRAL